MKILYIYQHFVTPEKSGITRTYELAKRLVLAGHEVHLIAADETFTQEKREPYTTENSGIKIHWLPIPYHNRLSFFPRLLAFARFVVGAGWRGRSLAFDVVYVSSPPLTATLPAIYLSHYKRVPMVLEVRDLWPDLPIVFGALKDPFSIGIAKKLERYAYSKARKVVALSPGIQKTVIDRGVPIEDTTLVPNSCDIDDFLTEQPLPVDLPRGIRSDDLIVLYPGTLGVANGISYLVYLAQHMKLLNPKIKFLVVGDGKEKERIHELANRVGVLNENFFIEKPIPKKQIPNLFKRASLIINTLVNHRELWHSSPNKFFDALAAAKPIAINFDGWLADLIRINDMGIVLHPTNVELAAKQIDERLKNPDWLKLAGKKAHQVGVEQFNRDILFQALHETLLSVVPEKDSSSKPIQQKKIA